MTWLLKFIFGVFLAFLLFGLSILAVIILAIVFAATGG